MTAKLTRNQVLKAIQAAGIDNDQRARLRLYTENRVSLAAANDAWLAGCRMRTQAITSRSDM